MSFYANLYLVSAHRITFQRHGKRKINHFLVASTHAREINFHGKKKIHQNHSKQENVSTQKKLLGSYGKRASKIQSQNVYPLNREIKQW